MDDAARLLHELVATPSVTGDTAAAVDAFVTRARAWGYEASVDEAGNGVAAIGRGQREILLVGHIDTVAPTLPVRVEDGVVHGRGAVDAKGPLVAFLAAARAFADHPTHRFVVVACCDEEGASHGARALIARHRPEALVIGEPSGVEGVTIGYRGMVRWRYHLEDDQRHAGAPEPGAADRAFAFWRSIVDAMGPPQERLADSATARLTRFRTEVTEAGRVRVDLVGEARLPVGADLDTLLKTADEAAGDAQLTVTEACPAWRGDKNAALTRAFVGAIRAEGGTPRYLRKTGTSDANVLAPAWNVPCVAYGPGDSSLDHTPHEALPLEDLARATRVVRRALAELTSAPSA